VENTHPYCQQFLLQFLLTFQPSFKILFESLVLNLVKDMTNHKILMYAKIIQHHVRYTAPVSKHNIYLNPNLIPTSHMLASFPYPDLQKFSPHSHITLSRHPMSVSFPSKKVIHIIPIKSGMNFSSLISASKKYWAHRLFSCDRPK
jgi:hypothetical protein